jgi:hypothetical protein
MDCFVAALLAMTGRLFGQCGVEILPIGVHLFDQPRLSGAAAARKAFASATVIARSKATKQSI